MASGAYLLPEVTDEYCRDDLPFALLCFCCCASHHWWRAGLLVCMSHIRLVRRAAEGFAAFSPRLLGHSGAVSLRCVHEGYRNACYSTDSTGKYLTDPVNTTLSTESWVWLTCFIVGRCVCSALEVNDTEAKWIELEENSVSLFYVSRRELLLHPVLIGRAGSQLPGNHPAVYGA